MGARAGGIRTYSLNTAPWVHMYLWRQGPTDAAPRASVPRDQGTIYCIKKADEY